MRLLTFILLFLAMFAAGDAVAGDRVQMRISLVLVDACTIHAREPGSAELLRVDCSSGQPHRVKHRLAMFREVRNDPRAEPGRLTVEF